MLPVAIFVISAGVAIAFGVAKARADSGRPCGRCDAWL
jgi:hypothetical protein